MRVITGTARGRRLEALPGEEVRPTADRVKEAMFSILHFQLEGRRVLDLFAGSGQLGIEALSRGAAEAVFVDASRKSIEVVRRNLDHTGLMERAKVVNSDFSAFLQRPCGRFDIALLDPPFSTGLLQRALPMVASVMNRGGVIVCEYPMGEELPNQAGVFQLAKTYQHGKIMLGVYRASAEE